MGGRGRRGPRERSVSVPLFLVQRKHRERSEGKGKTIKGKRGGYLRVDRPQLQLRHAISVTKQNADLI